MISAILPDIASDLQVSLQSIGHLVAIFSFSYAVSSPILTALTAAFDRRKLLIGSMAAFCATNAYAASAPGYDALVIARVLLAFSAGLYVPNANALAGALVPRAERGRALAIVTGGISAAVALGVPLGAFIGGRLGWRATFWGRRAPLADRDRRTAHRTPPRHRIRVDRRTHARSTGGGTTQRGASGPVDDHVMGNRRLHRLHLHLSLPG